MTFPLTRMNHFNLLHDTTVDGILTGGRQMSSYIQEEELVDEELATTD